MKKIILLILLTAFALTTGVSAVYAMTPLRYDSYCYNAAFFASGEEALCNCEMVFEIVSLDRAVFTARYDLINASTEPITAKIMQPIEYGSSGAIKVDGKETILKKRHTFDDDHYLDAYDAASKIRDDFYKDRYISPDLKVYKQTYKVDELNAPDAQACFTYEKNSDMVLVIGNRNYYHDDRGNEYRIYTTAYKNAELVVYELGECHEPKIEFVNNYYDKLPIDGKAEKVSVEELTLRNFIASFNDGDVSEVDYYNAVAEILKNIQSNIFDETDFDLYHVTNGVLIEWQCLEVPLEIGEKTTFEFSTDIVPQESLDSGFRFCLTFTSNSSVETTIDIVNSTRCDYYVGQAVECDEITNGKYKVRGEGDFYLTIQEDTSLSRPLLGFIVGFLGRIIAFPIALGLAALICKRKKDIAP